MQPKSHRADLVGRLVSNDCHLTVIVVDGRWAASWDAVMRDFDATQAVVHSPAFKRSRAFEVPVGAGRARLFRVGVVGTGYCAVYRVDDRIVLVEPDASYLNDNLEAGDLADVEPLVRELVERPLSTKAKPVGVVEVPSGVLLVGDMWSDYTGSAPKVKKLAAQKSRSAFAMVGDEDNGIALRVRPGRYALYPVKLRLPRRLKGLAEEPIGAMHIVPDAC